MARTILLGGLAVVAIACTVNNDNNEPFGVGTYSTTQYPPVPPEDEGSSSGSTGEEGETGDASSGGAAPEGDAETTGAADPTDATTDTGGAPADATDDGGALPDGNQPADGLWSQCTTPEECGPIPALCIYLVDDMMNPTDGFCSRTGCANPAVDCPSPGGTATPTCVPVDVDGPEQACALSCAAGVCPVGMSCVAITDLGQICI